MEMLAGETGVQRSVLRSSPEASPGSGRPAFSPKPKRRIQS
jgi:hypothetical protein